MFHLVGDVDTGIGHACVGQGIYGKPLHILLNFDMNVKLL